MGLCRGCTTERECIDEKRFLRASDVDPFTLVAAFYASGGVSLVNSKALALAGIDNNTPDPEGENLSAMHKAIPQAMYWPMPMNVFRELLPAESDAYRSENSICGMAECLDGLDQHS